MKQGLMALPKKDSKSPGKILFGMTSALWARFSSMMLTCRLRKDPAISRSEGGERWKGGNLTFQNIPFSWIGASRRSKVIFKIEEQ